MIDQDLAAIEETGGGLERLIEQLRFWHGGLRVEPGHFVGWSLGARFYPVLYMLTRMGEAKDWGDPFLPLKVGMLGKMSVLEVHHIFPKSQLYDRGYKRHEVNALANFCFLTKETNLAIGNCLPEEYFPEVEKACPGALKSQWIPMDSNLWHIDNYGEFLEARKILLAEETNKRLEELLHDDSDWLLGPSTKDIATPTTEETSISVVGGITSEKEEQELKELNTWVGEQGLPHGIIAYDFADGETGEQKAVFDLVWPEGVQRGLSQPVAVLLNEGAEVIALASGAGFRCFTSTNSFKNYIKHEIFS